MAAPAALRTDSADVAFPPAASVVVLGGGAKAVCGLRLKDDALLARCFPDIALEFWCRCAGELADPAGGPWGIAQFYEHGGVVKGELSAEISWHRALRHHPDRAPPATAAHNAAFQTGRLHLSIRAGIHAAEHAEAVAECRIHDRQWHHIRWRLSDDPSRWELHIDNVRQVLQFGSGATTITYRPAKLSLNLGFHQSSLRLGGDAASPERPKLAHEKLTLALPQSLGVWDRAPPAGTLPFKGSFLEVRVAVLRGAAQRRLHRPPPGTAGTRGGSPPGTGGGSRGARGTPGFHVAATPHPSTRSGGVLTPVITAGGAEHWAPASRANTAQVDPFPASTHTPPATAEQNGDTIWNAVGGYGGQWESVWRDSAVGSLLDWGEGMGMGVGSKAALFSQRPDTADRGHAYTVSRMMRERRERELRENPPQERVSTAATNTSKVSRVPDHLYHIEDGDAVLPPFATPMDLPPIEILHEWLLAGGGAEGGGDALDTNAARALTHDTNPATVGSGGGFVAFSEVAVPTDQEPGEATAGTSPNAAAAAAAEHAVPESLLHNTVTTPYSTASSNLSLVGSPEHFSVVDARSGRDAASVPNATLFADGLQTGVELPASWERVGETLGRSVWEFDIATASQHPQVLCDVMGQPPQRLTVAINTQNSGRPGFNRLWVRVVDRIGTVFDACAVANITTGRTHAVVVDLDLARAGKREGAQNEVSGRNAIEMFLDGVRLLNNLPPTMATSVEPPVPVSPLRSPVGTGRASPTWEVAARTSPKRGKQQKQQPQPEKHPVDDYDPLRYGRFNPRGTLLVPQPGCPVPFRFRGHLLRFEVFDTRYADDVHAGKSSRCRLVFEEGAGRWSRDRATGETVRLLHPHWRRRPHAHAAIALHDGAYVTRIPCAFGAESGEKFTFSTWFASHHPHYGYLVSALCTHSPQRMRLVLNGDSFDAKADTAVTRGLFSLTDACGRTMTAAFDMGRLCDGRWHRLDVHVVSASRGIVAVKVDTEDMRVVMVVREGPREFRNWGRFHLGTHFDEGAYCHPFPAYLRCLELRSAGTLVVAWHGSEAAGGILNDSVAHDPARLHVGTQLERVRGVRTLLQPAWREAAVAKPDAVLRFDGISSQIRCQRGLGAWWRALACGEPVGLEFMFASTQARDPMVILSIGVPATASSQGLRVGCNRDALLNKTPGALLLDIRDHVGGRYAVDYRPGGGGERDVFDGEMHHVVWVITPTVSAAVTTLDGASGGGVPPAGATMALEVTLVIDGVDVDAGDLHVLPGRVSAGFCAACADVPVTIGGEHASTSTPRPSCVFDGALAHLRAWSVGRHHAPHLDLPLDDGIGSPYTVADITRSRNTGTLVDTSWAPAPPGRKIMTVPLFNGRDSCLRLGRIGEAADFLTRFSIEFSVKFLSLKKKFAPPPLVDDDSAFKYIPFNATSGILGGFDSDGQGYAVCVDERSGTLWFVLADKEQKRMILTDTGAAGVMDGGWHHIKITIDDPTTSSATLTIDGHLRTDTVTIRPEFVRRYKRPTAFGPADFDVYVGCIGVPSGAVSGFHGFVQDLELRYREVTLDGGWALLGGYNDASPNRIHGVPCSLQTVPVDVIDGLSYTAERTDVRQTSKALLLKGGAPGGVSVTSPRASQTPTFNAWRRSPKARFVLGGGGIAGEAAASAGDDAPAPSGEDPKPSAILLAPAKLPRAGRAGGLPDLLPTDLRTELHIRSAFKTLGYDAATDTASGARAAAFLARIRPHEVKADPPGGGAAGAAADRPRMTYDEFAKTCLTYLAR